MPGRYIPDASRRESSGGCRTLFPHLWEQATSGSGSQKYFGHSHNHGFRDKGKQFFRRGNDDGTSVSFHENSLRILLCVCPVILCNQFQYGITSVYHEHFFSVASDAASSDFQTSGDSCGAESVEGQSKDFRSARCKFYAVLGTIHHLPDTTHNLYRCVYGKFFADTGKMQMYEPTRCT